MGVIIQPDSWGQVFKDIEQRLARLEGASGKNATVIVTDSAGRDRVIAGYDPRIPGDHYGLLIQDAAGNDVLDTVGLQAILSQIGSNYGTTGTLGPFAFTTTWTAIAATDSAFTVSRPVWVKPEAILTFYTTGGTANYGEVRLVIKDGGSVVKNSITSYATNGAGVMGATLTFLYQCLPGHNYTAELQYSMNAGATTTLTLQDSQTQVFQLGA